jgi:hypothetical protein
MAQSRAGSTSSPPYRIKAHSVECCSCHHGCNCQFGGFPREGKCEFLIAFEVIDGYCGDVDMSGVKSVVAFAYPGAIHEGRGRAVIFIDEAARPEQADALTTIYLGKAGGMPWEALAATLKSVDGPVRKPVEITVNGTKSRFRVPGALEVQMTPLRDVVSGAEKEVHIVYPKGGFFWNDGSICTTDTMRIDAGGLNFEYPGRYASCAEVNWTNQPTGLGPIPQSRVTRE